MALLQVHDLCAYYGKARVLEGIDFNILAGEVVALSGRNGAGKSTTLKALMGLLIGTTGHRVFAETDLGGLLTHEICRLGIGYVPEDRRIFTDLTVSENLEVGRRLNPPRDTTVPSRVWDTERAFDLFPVLSTLRHRKGGQMSGGEQQMLAIARTLMGNPRLVLLDEPSEGLSPLVLESVFGAVEELKRAGTAILLCEQNEALVEQLADRVYVMEKGRLIEELIIGPAKSSARVP